MNHIFVLLDLKENQMLKNKYIKNIIIFIIILILFLIMHLGYSILILKEQKNAVHFDLTKSPSSYQFKTYDDKKIYFEYIADFIEPKKLKNFIDFDNLVMYDYSDEATADDCINYLKFEAYTNLISSLFNKNRVNFDDCPVTDNFKTKFSINLYNYFGIDADDIYCHKEIDNKIIVEEYKDIMQDGTPLNTTLKYFHYVLSNDGEIDDIIYDYSEKY